MLSLASFSSFQLISLLPSDWPDPGWGVLELRSASEPARSAGKGDWKHVRWSKPWNKFFIWPNPRNLSRQKIWRGWRGPSAPPEHKEAQIRTKRKEKQNCIYIYIRGWNKNVKCRYQYGTHFLHIHLWSVELLRNVIKVTLLGGSGINYTSLCLLMTTHSSPCDFMPWFFIIWHTHIRCYICILYLPWNQWHVMWSVRNVTNGFPRDSQWTGTPQDFSKHCVIVTLGGKSILQKWMCVCVPQWNSQRFRISHSLSHTCTDTQTHTLPKVFCLFVLGVTLKPWCLATRPCSFKWQADIPIPSGCLTISPTYFSLSYCLSLFFTLVHTLPTPHTHIYKHTQRTLTDENWLLWSWRSTAAAKLITLRHRSQWTQLFQWCGQTPISITTAATFFLLICHAKEKNKKKKTPCHRYQELRCSQKSFSVGGPDVCVTVLGK